MRLVRGEGCWVLVGGPVPRGSAAITIWSLVSVRSARAEDQRLLRHELAHVEQWHRLGVVGFLRRYLWAYLKGRAERLGHREAYLRIPLEVEARWRSLPTASPPSSPPAAGVAG